MIAALNTGCRDRSACFVSIVMPVFNEVAILKELTDSVRTAMEDQCARLEIVYVNDGSSDGSRELLDQLAANDHRIVVVHLSRNFGHQPAVNAGLHQATGDVVVLMDSDLQDDPNAIPQMLSTWEDGFDVVYAQRFNRKESLPKRFLFHSFYRVLNAVADSPMPQDAGNFSLMDRCVVDAMKRLPERDLYLPGLRSWTGFRQTGIPVERMARHDDQPRVSLCGLFRLAKTAIFSFSSVPLTLFYAIAAISGLVCAGSVSFVLYHKLLSAQAVPGWTSVIITASFFGALNALGISVLGEYVIRIYDEVRARPVYLKDTERSYNPASVQRVDDTPKVDRVLEEIESQWNSRLSAQPVESD